MQLNARMYGLVFSDRVLSEVKPFKVNVSAFRRIFRRFDASDKEEKDIKEFLKDLALEFLEYDGLHLVKFPTNGKYGYYLEEAQQFEKPSLVYDHPRGTIYFYVVPEKRKIDERDTRSGKLKMSFYNKFDKLMRGKGIRYGFIADRESIRFVYADPAMISAYVEWDYIDLLDEENLATFYTLFSEKSLSVKKNSLFELIERSQNEQGEITFALSSQVREIIEMLLEKLETDQPGELVYDYLLRSILGMVMILYAEERGIFPHGDVVYDEGYGLLSLANKLLDPSVSEEELKERKDAWLRILALFNLIYSGSSHPKLSMVPHGGDLFSPDVVEFLCNIDLNNFEVREILRKLLYIEGYRVSYRVLSVEQIGYIYEGLLDYTVRKEDGRYILVETGERKSSGSYYTPPALVRYVVEKTLEDLVKDKSSDEILSLRILDPAMGSGAFLVHTVEYLAQHLVKAWEKEEKYQDLDYDSKLLEAKRQISVLCVYGVDKNPLAVELAKISLWLTTLSKNKAFSFLDHHLKVGNSLVGIWKETNISTIPDAVYDVKKDLFSKEYIDSVKSKRKFNKEYLKGKLSLFTYIPSESGKIVKDLAKKRMKFVEYSLRQNDYAKTLKVFEEIESYYDKKKEKMKRDAFLANYFANEVDGVLPLTSEELNEAYDAIEKGKDHPWLEWAEKISKEIRFFHWDLEFPEIFERGGFDAVVGNPPWDVWKIEDRKFFATRLPEIANITKTNERKEAIEKLKETHPDVYNEYVRAKQICDGQGKLMSSMFELTGKGELNLYALFAERFYMLSKERFGIIVPTGLFTDKKNSEFFSHLVGKERIGEINDFENRKKIFQNIDSRMRFSLFISKPSKEIKVRIMLTSPDQLYSESFMSITKEDLKLMNPNTLTLPMVKDAKDLEILRKIYSKSVIIKNEETRENPFGIYVFNMFHMSNDSHLFTRRFELEKRGCKRIWYYYKCNDGIYLPLLEGKSIHILDSRFNHIEDNGNAVQTTEEEKSDPHFFPRVRYYIREDIINHGSFKPWKWMIAYRNITNSTNERTMIITPIRSLPCGHSLYLLKLDLRNVPYVLLLSSHILDFVIRLKNQGTNISPYIFHQLPLPKPGTLEALPGIDGDENLYESVKKIIISLVNYSYDLEPFVKELGGKIKPRRWDERERLENFAKLDAIVAHVYGLTRDELEHVFDDFKVERKNQEEKYGEYLSRRLALEYYEKYSEVFKEVRECR